MASGGAGELGGEGGGIASALQAIADQPMQTTGVPDLRGWKLPDGKLVIPFQCLAPSGSHFIHPGDSHVLSLQPGDVVLAALREHTGDESAETFLNGDRVD